MSYSLQLVTCLLLIGAFSFAFGGGSDQVPSNAQEGDPCTPRSLKRCGDLKLVGETVTALEEEAGRVG